MNWADLFERAEACETDVETIRGALAARREGTPQGDDPEEETDA